jgi:hypothetical protein
MATQIAVIGGSDASEPVVAAAEAVGAGLAAAGAIVVCGGLGGVMAAACRGARSAGGTTVGILPGSDPSAANPWVDVVVAPVSEIALALRAGTPVIGVGTWSLTRPDGEPDTRIVPVEDPAGAVALALHLAAAD